MELVLLALVAVALVGLALTAFAARRERAALKTQRALAAEQRAAAEAARKQRAAEDAARRARENAAHGNGGGGGGGGGVPCDTSSSGRLADASSLVNPAHPSLTVCAFTAKAARAAPAAFCCLR